MTTLFKTTVTIWTEYDPDCVELSDLIHDAECGDAICSGSKIKAVLEPTKDKDCTGSVREFFMLDDEE